jgi:hypothetical protein
MVWPTALAAGTLLTTLLVFALISETAVVGVSADLDPVVVAQIEEAGWAPLVFNDLKGSVRDRDSWAATDGHTLWTRWRPDSLRLESLLREHDGASWRPDPIITLPSVQDSAPQGLLFCQLVAVLFALYGVVFGLGMVARDRDDGTLESELSLPLPHWVAGASRWLAATLVLSLFFSFSVVLFDALIGVPDPGAMIRHGIAATGGATAMGLLAVGKAGLKQGFSGPLAGGLTVATGLIGLGLSKSPVATLLPLASIFGGGNGWIPVAAAMALGVLAAVGFAYRSART